MFTTFLLLLQSQDKRSGGTSLKSLLAPRAKAVSKSRLPTPTIRAPMATGNSCRTKEMPSLLGWISRSIFGSPISFWLMMAMFRPKKLKDWTTDPSLGNDYRIQHDLTTPKMVLQWDLTTDWWFNGIDWDLMDGLRDTWNRKPPYLHRKKPIVSCRFARQKPYSIEKNVRWFIYIYILCV